MRARRQALARRGRCARPSCRANYSSFFELVKRVAGNNPALPRALGRTARPERELCDCDFRGIADVNCRILIGVFSEWRGRRTRASRSLLRKCGVATGRRPAIPPTIFYEFYLGTNCLVFGLATAQE